MSEEAIQTFKRLNRDYSVVFFGLIACLLLSSIYVSNIGAVLGYDAVLFTYLNAVSYALTALFLVFAYAYPQAVIKKVQAGDGFTEKIAIYRTAISRRMLLIGLAGLATCVFFVLTADTNLMVVLAIILIFLILARPTPFKTAADLSLSDEEKRSLMR